jgi:hypothetical protein
MNRKFLPIAVFVLIFALAAGACSGKSSSSSSHATPADDDDDASPAPDDDASPGDDDASPPVMRTFDATLEFRNTCHIVWGQDGDALVDATVKCGSGYGDDLVTPGLTMKASSGTVLHFPEAQTDLYTLILSGPPITTGPCGKQSIQYAIALSGEQVAVERYGSMAAYCGDTIAGQPARILRLTTMWK